jgi:hypothetical protein
VAACRVSHREPIHGNKVKKVTSFYLCGCGLLNDAVWKEIYLSSLICEMKRIFLRKWCDLLFSWRDWEKSTNEGNQNSWCSIKSTKVRVRSKIQKYILNTSLRATPTCSVVTYWDCGIESSQWHGSLSSVSAVFCQVDVSASGWSFIQSSPTESNVSECDLEASTVRTP